VTPLLLAPTIYTISVFEPNAYKNGSPSLLEIDGDFGSQRGTVTITPPGGSASNLPHAKWSPAEITVPIPSSGAKAAGMVTVISSTGIPSNEVPITLWQGTVTVTDSISVTSIAPPSGGEPVDGSGSFTSSGTFKVQFRADVHPWRPHVDATPLPATLWFGNVMASSTGKITKIGGSFKGEQTINNMKTTYKLRYSPPPATPIAAYPVVDGINYIARDFNLGSSNPTDQCSRSMNDGSGLPVCLGFYMVLDPAATCKDDPKNTLCGDPGYGSSETVDYSLAGYNAFVKQLLMTMDPATYRVSVPTITYPDSDNESDWPNTFTGTGTTTYTFSFKPPVSPPTSTTPAVETAP
jgi:hypothetical protein